MSDLMYSIDGASTANYVKLFVKNYSSKINLKNLTHKMTSTISEELQKLKTEYAEVDKLFQKCNEDLISQEKSVTQTEDDDVLLVGDNFHSIACKEIAIHTKVFVCKNKEEWYEGILFEITNTDGAISERKYWVRFHGKGRSFPFNSKKIAFSEAPSDKLSVGTRVIAMHRGGNGKGWHSGVVAEPPTLKNKNRYLVFFDDGYAQYNTSSDIRQVYDQNKCVWEDVSGETSNFIKDYIQQYPNRSMVRLKPGHLIKTERDGFWSSAIVVVVDASLVKMMFTNSKVEEWIYRGSKRLEPLFNELKKAEASQRLGRAPRFRTDPKLQKKGAYVVYTMQSDENDAKKDVELIDLDPEPGSGAKKPVARKSCSQNHNSLASLIEVESQTDAVQEPDGVLQNIDRSLIPRGAPLKKNKKPCIKCSSKCIIAGGDNPSKFKGSNPLLIPMLYGWERKITKSSHGRKKAVVYIAYCGRVLKNIDDLDQCLMQSDSKLTIDLFSFDANLNTDQEFVVTKNFCDIKDFSLGKENVPIPCVNSVDRQFPEYIEYSTHRIPGEGVNLNVDSNFLVGCNCTDNCRDRTKCQCIKLTIDATDCIPSGSNSRAGYNQRRLKQPIVTGLYECNSNCSCDHRCHNRVIQHGLNLRLQIFKTKQKGWGLRSMDDIPVGGFICVYSGQILTEESANEDGQMYGDEYLADLDHIDVVEKEKEGYESDVRMDDDDEENVDEDEEDDDDDEEDVDCLKWLKNYNSKILNLERKPNVRRSSIKPSNQPKPVARKFASKKTSAPTWSSKSIGKLKDHKQKSDSRLKQVKYEGGTKRSSNVKPIEDENMIQNTQEENKPNIYKDETGDIKTKPSQKENKSPKSDEWNDEMYDDLEIEIDENEVEETNDIEEPMITDVVGENFFNYFDTSSNNSNTNQSKESKLGLKKNDDNVFEKMDVHATFYDATYFNKDIVNRQVVESYGAQVPQSMPEFNQRIQSHFLEKVTDRLRKTTRQLYGEEAVYIIDAKSIGNLGRYFNHSCSPNIFVQNVFYDTHDLRFPWVAFFASKLIKAGTELTWNYNYEVGSVPGKKLACHCGSANCNGRLL